MELDRETNIDLDIDISSLQLVENYKLNVIIRANRNVLYKYTGLVFRHQISSDPNAELACTRHIQIQIEEFANKIYYDLVNKTLGENYDIDETSIIALSKLNYLRFVILSKLYQFFKITSPSQTSYQPVSDSAALLKSLLTNNIVASIDQGCQVSDSQPIKNEPEITEEIIEIDESTPLIPVTTKTASQKTKAESKPAIPAIEEEEVPSLPNDDEPQAIDNASEQPIFNLDIQGTIEELRRKLSKL